MFASRRGRWPLAPDFVPVFVGVDFVVVVVVLSVAGEAFEDCLLGFFDGVPYSWQPVAFFVCAVVDSDAVSSGFGFCAHFLFLVFLALGPVVVLSFFPSFLLLIVSASILVFFSFLSFFFIFFSGLPRRVFVPAGVCSVYCSGCRHTVLYSSSWFTRLSRVFSSLTSTWYCLPRAAIPTVPSMLS